MTLRLKDRNPGPAAHRALQVLLSIVEEMHSDAEAMISMNKALLLALFKKLKAANQKIERLMLG